MGSGTGTERSTTTGADTEPGGCRGILRFKGVEFGSPFGIRELVGGSRLLPCPGVRPRAAAAGRKKISKTLCVGNRVLAFAECVCVANRVLR
jgi:hypothetical protein